MRDPQCDRFADEYELICIWRAILDAMALSTLVANLRRIQLKHQAASEVFSIQDSPPHLGNPKLQDRVGMGVDITMLHSSRWQGSVPCTCNMIV
ncbi:LOW QUALITY PROTEIN: hypothetical protein ACHAW6_004793 [Cyclotella cf. meneghiniana]